MYQKLVIIGRLGRDPEMRFTPTGQAVTSFSVATDRSYTDQAGKPVKETVWFKVSAWGKLAETCNTYLQKGKLVLVEGRLTADKSGGPRVWTGQDGTPRATLRNDRQHSQIPLRQERRQRWGRCRRGHGAGTG